MPVVGLARFGQGAATAAFSPSTGALVAREQTFAPTVMILKTLPREEHRPVRSPSAIGFSSHQAARSIDKDEGRIDL